MIPKFKDLPRWLKLIVLKRVTEQLGELREDKSPYFSGKRAEDRYALIRKRMRDVNNQTVDHLLHWRSTPEGREFWINVNKGVYISEQEYIATYTANGGKDPLLEAFKNVML